MRQNILAIVMKQIATEETISGRLVELVNALPLEQQENAIDILLGEKKYIRDEKTAKFIPRYDPEKKRNFFISSISYNRLEDLVKVYYTYEILENTWYKTQEDAKKEQNGYWKETEEYTIKKGIWKQRATESSFSREEWNSGELHI